MWSISCVTYEYHVNCGRTNEVKVWSLQLCLRFKQSQLSPKNVFGASTGFEPMASTNWGSYPDEALKTFFGLNCNCLNRKHNCDDHTFTSLILYVRSSHNIQVFHSFHGYDEFNKLACSQSMGLGVGELLLI